MSYHQIALLDTEADAQGEPVDVSDCGRLLFVVDLDGEDGFSATVSVQGRQREGVWHELDSFGWSGELNLDNYGWHEVRATACELAGARVRVGLSWR